jgi:hypothetical protein
MVIQQSMARKITPPYYHASATFPLANHSDFFNTHAWFHKPSKFLSHPGFSIAGLSRSLACESLSNSSLNSTYGYFMFAKKYM